MRSNSFMQITKQIDQQKCKQKCKQNASKSTSKKASKSASKTASKTQANAELSAETNSNVYKGTVENLDYGLVTVKIDVYVDGTVYSTTSEDYMIMTGLNTKFAGTAAVTITEGKVGIKFDSSSIPTDQPEQSKIS